MAEVINELYREKYWEELDDKEKIERLAEQIKHLCRENIVLSKRVRELMNHIHADGKLLTPIKNDEHEIDPIPYWMKNPLNKELK